MKTYLEQKASYEKFLEIYKDEERNARITKSKEVVTDEVVIASNSLAAEQAKNIVNLSPPRSYRKRQRVIEEDETDSDQDILFSQELENPFTEEPSSFTITRNQSVYEIHTPSSRFTTSPNKPITQTQDRTSLDRYFDTRLSTDTAITCSPETNQEFLQYEKDAQQHCSLKHVLGDDYNIFNKIFNLPKSGFSRNLFNLEHTESAFIEFLKYSMNDMCINWNDPDSYVGKGERTIFCETFLQQFKIFGKMKKLLKYKWVEKKQTGVEHPWMVKHKYVNKDVHSKTLDGIGIMQEKINYLLIESSGIEDNTYKHTLEDTIKNFKHATDSLTLIMSENKQSSFNTMKKVHVLTAHVIADKVTIIKYQLSNNEKKWKAIEVRSSIVPLKWENRKQMIKMYELFAFIYINIQEQIVIHGKLEDESLSLVQVSEDDLMKNNFK